MTRFSRRTDERIAASIKNIDANQIGENHPPSPHFDHGNVIYGLLGAGVMVNADTPVDPAANDLIGALHAQYCRALNDPLATLGVEWGVPATPAHESLSELRLGESPHVESIETLLSGARSVEDVFGALAAGDVPDPAALTGAPEILRLFAPPEFKARASRLPPTLVRREHHAVGIDSPLLKPGVSTVPAESSTDI